MEQNFRRGRTKNVWDYMARANFLLRHTHKVDLAIYHQSYGYFSSYTNDGSNIVKDDNWLNQNGFTYEFLSSKLINHKNCVVQNGVLDWDGASYKALIIDNQEFLDYNTALKLKEFSDNGLPVIFVGKMPTRLAMFSENHKDEDLNALLKSISAIYVTNIRVVPSELAKIGILPDAIPNSSSSMLYPVHLKVGNASFYYVYNGNYICMQNPETFYPSINKERHMHPYSGELKLRGEGEVYELNGFDGTVKKINSVKTGEYVKFNTSLVRDEAKMFAILTPEQAKELGISAEYAKEYELESITTLKNWTLDI
ncbi:MAG: glycosyl hydrolase, partial [Acutalibacteraceae bacterium]